MAEASLPATHASLPCGWFAADDSGRVIAANPALGRMLGTDPATLVGGGVESMLTFESRVLYLSHVAPMLKLRGEVAEVTLTLAGSGGPVDALLYARRELRGDEAVSEFVVARLHERKRLEDQLLTARRAAEQVPGIVFKCQRGSDGRISFPYMTAVVHEMYGLAPVQLRGDGKRLFDAIDPEQRESVLAAMTASAEALTHWRAEYRVAHPPGQLRWHEVNAVPRRQPDGTIIWYGFIADVTERRALVSAETARRSAETASRAKSDFLARVSHELRTPLNGVLGFAQLLLVDADSLTPTQRRHLGYIERAGRHLLLLINDMLDITRIESGKVVLRIEPVDAFDALHECLQFVAPLAGKAEVQIQIAASRSCRVLADRDRLRQALLNLASNAIKYGGSGGIVTLALSDDASTARIEVIDRGPGLTAEQTASLFEPFNRLGAEHSPVEGTGLGLVITRGLVELMGGRLEVSSTPGAGSTFAITLPKADRAAGG